MHPRKPIDEDLIDEFDRDINEIPSTRTYMNKESANRKEKYPERCNLRHQNRTHEENIAYPSFENHEKRIKDAKNVQIEMFANLNYPSLDQEMTAVVSAPVSIPNVKRTNESASSSNAVINANPSSKLEDNGSKPVAPGNKVIYPTSLDDLRMQPRGELGPQSGEMKLQDEINKEYEEQKHNIQEFDAKISQIEAILSGTTEKQRAQRAALEAKKKERQEHRECERVKREEHRRNEAIKRAQERHERELNRIRRTFSDISTDVSSVGKE